jgi:hypothetical protein
LYGAVTDVAQAMADIRQHEVRKMSRRMSLLERAAREVLDKTAVQRPDSPKSKISLPRLKFMERDMPADIAPPKPKPPVRRKRRALP